MPVDEGPLHDAKDILELKPTLTNKEKVIADKLRPQLRAIMRSEIRTELEAEYIKNYRKFQDETVAASRDAVKQAVETWKAEQEPLSQTDIQTLLSQDYIQFEVSFKTRHGKVMKFNLVELPQEIETKFLKTVKAKFIPLIKSLSASEFKLDLDSSAVEKLQSILEAAPDVLEVLAEIVAICLDPWKDNIEYGPINKEWVMTHMGSYRILAVVMGQIEVNRYRDFFLNGFRLSKSLK